MEIDEFFTVENDQNGWTLSYDKPGEINPQTGKVTHTTWQTYHISLAQCLKKYLDSSFKPLSEVGLILDTIERVEANIDALMKSNTKTK